MTLREWKEQLSRLRDREVRLVGVACFRHLQTCNDPWL